MNYLQKHQCLILYIKYWHVTTNIPYILYILYIYLYIYTFLYPLKYIKAAATGQSEELFCPILKCLNILQPCIEDTEMKRKKESKDRKEERKEQ